MRPIRSWSTATIDHSVEDAWVERIEVVNEGLRTATVEQRHLLTTAFTRSGDTSTAGVLAWSSVASMTSSTATARPIRVPVVGGWLDMMKPVFEYADEPEVRSETDAKEAMMDLRARQHKLDRRGAIVAGILSGLGIRPRRPRNPLERMDAALLRASQTELIDGRY